MKEINAYIYGKKIGVMVEYDGIVYFQYDKKFKLEGLEISPIKLHTTKIKDAYTNTEQTTLYNGIAGVFFDFQLKLSFDHQFFYRKYMH